RPEARFMIEIRPASIDEFLDIAALDRTAWGDNRESEFIPDGEHSWRLWVEYGTVIIARTDTGLAGVALAFPTNVPDLHYFHKLFVASDLRERRVGTGLVGGMCDAMDQLGAALRLTTDPVNIRMQRLCASFGFTEREFVAG